MTAWCVLPHNQAPPPAAGGLHVCGRHRGELGETVAALPMLSAELVEYLAASPTRGERVGGSRAVGLSIADPVVECRAAIHRVLAVWCGIVARARCIRTPEDARPVTLAAWLGQHVNWLCTQPEVAEFHAAVTAAAADARRLRRHSTRVRRPVAGCPRAECGGTLYTSADTDPVVIVCDRDAAHSWPGGQWRQLRRALPGRDPWLPLSVLSALYAVPGQTLRRWRVLDGWRSVRAARSGRGRPAVRYHVDDVEASVRSRRGVVAEAGGGG